MAKRHIRLQMEVCKDTKADQRWRVFEVLKKEVVALLLGSRSHDAFEKKQLGTSN